MDTALQQLAERYGIESGYWDIWGHWHHTSAETRRALLAAMGVPAAIDAEVRESLAEHEARAWRRILPPVHMARETQHPLIITLSLTAEQAQDTVRWILTREDGERCEGELLPAELEQAESREIGGILYTRYRFELPLVPWLGYHRFEVMPARGRSAAMSLIVTPQRCYEPLALAEGGRVWGLAVQLYTLRTQGNWGIGDFSDLRRLLGCGAELGAGIVALNPLHALFPHKPAQASPYSPSSRLFLNIFYLDVEAISDLVECEAAQQAMQAAPFQERLHMLRQAELVDYPGVAAVKLPVLEQLYRCFREKHLEQGSERANAFRAFQHDGGEALRLHALYEALQERFYREDPTVWGWPVWPEEYRDPGAPAVAEFALEQAKRVEFYEYLQWQADAQLGEAAKRAEELHLAVGLYQDLAVSVDRSGAEAWANQTLYAQGANIGAPPDDFAPKGQDWGLPPLVPNRLIECAYAPFVATLRHTMHHAGALRLDHVMGLMRLFWVPPGKQASEGAYVRYPLHELLGILALESQRNRCLVIGEDLGTVPDEVRGALKPLGVLSYRLFYYARDYHDPDKPFLPPERYPAQALAAVTTQDLPTLAGWWVGKDIEVRAELNAFPSDEVRDQQVRARLEDRAQVLRALDAEGLLPEGVNTAPGAVEEMTPALSRAVHLYLARTPTRVMVAQLEDLLGQLDQVNLPGTTDEYPNWRRKLPVNLADLFANPDVRETAAALTRERGPGANPPSNLPPNSPNGEHRGSAAIPRATYRLQFNADFTFAKAAALTSYLADLGISHCYASPYLRARAGSTHGYDIVDHNAINPEIGGSEDYERFVDALHQHRMGQVLDIVPNHMGVGSDDNGWWMDVLENGQASIYARFFDIDWRPIKDELRGKVLVPFLGERYGSVLENGGLKLQFEPETGAFAVCYYEHRFPIDPSTYPVILSYHVYRLEALLGTAHPDFIELQSLISGFEHLPARTEVGGRRAEDKSEEDKIQDRIRERNRDKEVHKRRLTELYQRSPEVARFIDGNLVAFNGTAGEPWSFELLHGLLEQQAYRLASWRAASDEINYRRFFDVNQLAGLRTELPEVFHATHRLILDLIGTGKLNGLRIDHPDGLYDPVQYYERLQSAVSAMAERAAQGAVCAQPGQESNGRAMPLYVVVEKILASYEHLPQNWPVHGTTGYEFANLVNGLLVYAESERYLDRIYGRFIDARLSFDDVVYERKKLLMSVALNGELAVLASELNAIAESDRHTRDFTLAGLRGALREVVACFPVYRTYVTGQRVTAEDRRYVDWAVAQAKKRSTAADTGIFDFIRDILLLDAAEGKNAEYRAAVTAFAMKFQQYTAPVMAKGVEDTAFYVYDRLVSLNEVGGDPRRYGVSMAAFHRTNQERVKRWPHTMLSTSTHDNKRSEDVRARITVLSEMPGEWRTRLMRWSRFNRKKKQAVNDQPAPSRNDEYLLYQTLIGAWPLSDLGDEGLAAFRNRIEAYMCKAVKEAKVHTSWINPNTAYEEALVQFVRGLLSSMDRNLFLQDFIPFQKRISRFGLLNSLSQTLLKLTVPGVPDIYQGNEVWALSLVDPDNRRPVDYVRQQAMLAELKEYMAIQGEQLASRARRLVDAMEDGRIKLYLTWKVLSLRGERPELFQRGNYLPLDIEGNRADHLCAFARAFRDTTIMVVAPRWFARLMGDSDEAPLGSAIWADTWVEAPAVAQAGAYTNLLTGERVSGVKRDGRAFLPAQELLASFPVAVLISG